MRRLIELNFIFCVWVVIVIGGVFFGYYWTGNPSSLSGLASLHDQTIVMTESSAMTTGILSILSIIFWYRHYKDNDGHAWALCIALIVTMILLNTLISNSINDFIPIGGYKIILAYLYVCISHFLFAFLNYKEIFGLK